MRISNEENDSFALIPIFAYDDDYVPLSPVGTPTSEAKSSQNRELTTVTQLSEIPLSRTASLSPEHLLSALNENNLSMKSNSDIEMLDIINLDDPEVRILSKFSFKDSEDQFQFLIYGKKI